MLKSYQQCGACAGIRTIMQCLQEMIYTERFYAPEVAKRSQFAEQLAVWAHVQGTQPPVRCFPADVGDIGLCSCRGTEAEQSSHS